MEDGNLTRAGEAAVSGGDRRRAHERDRRRLAFLSGMPRSGSTLLANILASHPQIDATPTSPLFVLVQKLRAAWSNEPSFLAQLDSDFDGNYRRVQRAVRAFMEAWGDDGDRPVVVDKHRGWLFAIEMLMSLYDDVKMIVCLRDLRAVYNSIERQHRRTILLDFPDDTERDLVGRRASQLFSRHGVIGGPLRALHNLSQVPGARGCLFFVKYESLCDRPRETLSELLEWLEVESFEFDLCNIRQRTRESDSYYRFKYPHDVRGRLQASRHASGDPATAIFGEIADRFGWYYRAFYGQDGVRLEAANEMRNLE